MIREASIKDLDNIMDMLKLIKIDMLKLGNTQWNEDYPLREDISLDIYNKDMFVYDENDIKGFICINKTEPKEYSNIAWSTNRDFFVLHRMGININYRKEGIATFLISFAEELSKKHGVKYIRTDTCELNLPMLRLFTKLGYKRLSKVNFKGREENYICFDKIL